MKSHVELSADTSENTASLALVRAVTPSTVPRFSGRVSLSSAGVCRPEVAILFFFPKEAKVSISPMVAIPSMSRVDTGVNRPWRWSQHWRDLLFTHWRVAKSDLAPLLPAGLELDTHLGAAWVTAVAFRLERVRPRFLPALGPVSNFLELNLRTYVHRLGEPAIFFLSIHANSRLAVTLARLFTPLPYAPARIEYAEAAESLVFRASRRGGGKPPPIFRAAFTPTGVNEARVADSLGLWLLERYCAFFAGQRGRLLRMIVRHSPWRVQAVSPAVAAYGLGEPWGLDLSRTPDCCHYSSGVHALVSPFESVSLAATVRADLCESTETGTMR